MSLTRTAWVKLNRLHTGIGCFGSSMDKWGLTTSVNYERGASEQTAHHIILTCPIHQAPQEIMGLAVFDDETRCSASSLPASDLDNTAGWGGKRINPQPLSFSCA